MSTSVNSDLKLIFLDIDGVLNIQSTSYYSCGYTVLGNNPIEPHLMCRLEFIMERVPNCKIVLSSSWGLSQFITKMKKARFKYIDRILDRTPRVEDERGDQIKDWIDSNNFTGNYIVLEDEIDDVCIRCSAIPRANVIEVDINEGLSNKDAIETILKLNDIQEYDGKTYEFNKENYDKFLKLGYEAHVVIPEPIDYDVWDKFTISNKHVTLNMSGRRIENE